MSYFRRCDICGWYGWSSSHECPPKWYVRHEEDLPEDAWSVYAADAKAAAERYFSDNFDEVDEEEEEILLVSAAPQADSHWRRVKVWYMRTVEILSEYVEEVEDVTLARG